MRISRLLFVLSLTAAIATPCLAIGTLTYALGDFLPPAQVYPGTIGVGHTATVTLSNCQAPPVVYQLKDEVWSYKGSVQETYHSATFTIGPSSATVENDLLKNYQVDIYHLGVRTTQHKLSREDGTDNWVQKAYATGSFEVVSP